MKYQHSVVPMPILVRVRMLLMIIDDKSIGIINAPQPHIVELPPKS